MKQVILIFWCFFSLLLYAQKQAPLSYVAFKTSEEINIDGKASEEAWKLAKWSENFIDIEGVETPAYKTNVKMLWDEEYLYFYTKMEEPHIWATLKQRDTVIFYNNDFEIFIDPDGDAQNYMEFEINALNTVWDLLLVKAYREGGHAIDSWDIAGVKSAVYIEGSLNDPGDQDKFWNVEIAMPWEVLTETSPNGSIPANDFWRINFSRVNWDFQLKDGKYSRKQDNNGNYLPEYNWVWSPQGVINMHEPEHWGYVYFSDKKPGGKEAFTIPKDEKIKWFLYELYRKQKSYHQKHKKWALPINKLVKGEMKIDGEKVRPKLEIHETGWNISVLSPFTGNKLIIKENGDFIKENSD
ncbi:carbohydrate-binding family 9-like protein [Gramella sp. AN32]|uniref:Carbohydrate-binding family 9-like protein n=1 Tax=Christiangramia antarctica TaxID=2058158 RepID=A0ABW5X242_9FLAO|nr:carbohydrate-binding family 9-like protein [Gramella sp. AN32]MCM4156977.1 carbohydrate-binding family 9-like protein [Gramella sp. AN32]